MLRKVVFLCLLAAASGFTAGTGGAPATRISTAHRGRPPLMMAKKKSKPRKPTPAKKQPAAMMPPPPPPQRLDASPLDASPLGAASPPSPAAAADERPLEERLDAALRNAGIEPSSAMQEERSRAPADPLSRIPKKGQALLETFFGGGAVLFGVIFLFCGLAISAEALCKVLGTPLPEGIDEFLVESVEPAMTPSILTLFAFSISLGLLKQLQLGSESAGVLYTEDDDD